MKHIHNRRKLSSWFGLIVVAGFYAFITFPRLFPAPGSHKLNNTGAPVTANTIYKTIYSTDDSSSLIGFELHSTTIPQQYGAHKECSVVVREMDPAKDDYKTYCKDIAKDLLTMYGNSDITINIYDSFEAYSLAVDEHKLLSVKEAQYIKEHKIAALEAFVEDRDKYVCLTYYPEAGNKRYFKEYLDL